MHFLILKSFEIQTMLTGYRMIINEFFTSFGETEPNGVLYFGSATNEPSGGIGALILVSQ